MLDPSVTWLVLTSNSKSFCNKVVFEILAPLCVLCVETHFFVKANYGQFHLLQSRHHGLLSVSSTDSNFHVCLLFIAIPNSSHATEEVMIWKTTSGAKMVQKKRKRLRNPTYLSTYLGRIGISDQAHTSFWCAVRTLTRTELWRCEDNCTRTAHAPPKNQFKLKNFQEFFFKLRVQGKCG